MSDPIADIIEPMLDTGSLEKDEDIAKAKAKQIRQQIGRELHTVLNTYHENVMFGRGEINMIIREVCQLDDTNQ